MNIYIGFDSSNYGQELAYEVCKRSILKYNKDLNITKLKLKDLKKKNIYKRKDNSGSTEFTYTRFLVPHLNNYKGWALFCDSDFLWFCDPTEILEKYGNKKYAILCVKHEYKNCNGKQKMDGREQEWYPRKNWSSLMLFNCDHPDIKKLTLDNVNTQSPAWLHRMVYCNDDNIGSIPKDYNYLVSYYNDNKYKALHFTDGGPWHEKYRNVDFGNLWINYLTHEEKNKLFKYNYDVCVFYNSINKGKNSTKDQILTFLYNSIPKDVKKNLETKNTTNINSKVCVMLSYYNENRIKMLENLKEKRSKPLAINIARKEIFNNNKNSNWIFFEANPLARYRDGKFNIDNEFIRICLDNQYHSMSKYLDGDKKRWDMILKKINLKVEPWRKDGKYILFILNSCKYCGYSMKNEDIHSWVNKKIKIIRDSGCKRKILIRLKCGGDNIKKGKKFISHNHLNETIKYHDPIDNIEFASQKKMDLADLLKKAWCTVLYSTTACVISIVKGIPVFCESKDAITYEISNNDFTQIENPNMPARDKFFHTFSNQIWSLKEIKDGIVWDKIKYLLHL